MTEISTVAKEIERKFLLSALPEKVAEAYQNYNIQHRWLPGEVIQERITWNSRNGGECWRAIKTGKGIERIEAQERISAELWKKLDAICGPKCIFKTRWCVKEGDLIWEIDEFIDKNHGLILAEIEIPKADYDLKIPAWLQPYVVKEVTEDPSYLNINLVK
jgi:adenylate cyclase